MIKSGPGECAQEFRKRGTRMKLIPDTYEKIGIILRDLRADRGTT
jgi:hypothetical protein